MRNIIDEILENQENDLDTRPGRMVLSVSIYQDTVEKLDELCILMLNYDPSIKVTRSHGVSSCINSIHSQMVKSGKLPIKRDEDR